MDPTNERKLIENAQGGCLDSFGCLYKRHYSSMVALAYSVLGNRHDAEDATQETFSVACRDLPKLKRKEKFAAWLAGICRNTTRQMLRRRRNTTELTQMDSPDKKEGQTEFHDMVRKAVWKLKPAERELVVLRYFNGFTQAQIADVLDISTSAVNGRLVRAKRKVAEYLKQDGFTGGDHEDA